MLARIRVKDSSEKPTVRHERGLVTYSLPEGTPKKKEKIIR